MKLGKLLALGMCALGALAQVETARVVSRPVERSIKLTGDLVPFQAVDIFARVPGYLESIPVDRGSAVKKGQVIAELSAPEMQAQVAEVASKVAIIESQRAEAEAKVATAQSTYDRMKAASATAGAVAGNELYTAEKSVAAAKSILAALDSSKKSAEAAADTLRENLAYLRLTAPFDGIVTERDAHPGALVGPGRDRLMRIEQVSRLRLVVPVPEADAGSIVRGGAVTFTVSAYPGQLFRGKIARVPRSLDPKTRTMPVEADVVNTGSRLSPGMYADVSWPARGGRASLLVPAGAVVTTTERTFVIRVAGGRAEWVDVKKGRPSGDLVEVISPGLQDGDVVVRRATDEIRDGSSIRVK
jgi:RND family efflux transporter MFP subunit